MTVMEFLNEFELTMSEEKCEIVALTTSPILVNGDAGSGKTFLFLSRIAYLLNSSQAQPEELVNFVFGKQNLSLMKIAYANCFGKETKPVFTDFFSFCYRIVQFHDEKNGLELKKAYRDMEKVASRIVKEQFDLDMTQEELKRLMQRVSYCKSMMLKDKDIAEITFDYIDFPIYYKAYEKFKKTNNIYDQDDVLCEAAKILIKDADIVGMYRDRYRFIHVDEAEELSFSAHLILRLLCGEHTQMFMCADANQCVEKQWSSYPQALETFQDAYPGGQIFSLKENHCHNKTIGDLANTFMFDHKERLISINEETCDVKFKGFAEVHKMYAYALKKVSEDEEETAFLYHDAAFAIPLLDVFKEQQVACSFQGNIKKILREPFISDICNFVELFIDPKDMQAFYAIYKKMGLDISNRVLLEVSRRLSEDEHIDVYQAIMESSYKVAGKKKLASNMEEIRKISTATTLEMMDYVIDKLGFDSWMKKANIEMTNSVVIAMKVMADRYPNPVEFLQKMRELGEFEFLDSSRIYILSVAQSKGRHFSRVCLIDCAASVFPRKGNTKEDKLQERRAFYVAITRALHNIEFFTFKKCFQTRLEISPFIYELYEKQEGSELVSSPKRSVSKKLKESELRRGTRICHSTLGEGKIMKVSEGMMHVQFKEENKTLNVKLCLLNKLIELI